MNPITIKPDAQGKVRDIYDLGDTLLFVATDRISAFDYILEDEIPHKGQVLTQISCFWFELLEGVVENHLVSSDVNDLPEQFKEWSDYLNGRFMIVKKAQMIPENGQRMRHRASFWPAEFRQASPDAVHAFHEGRDRRPRREHQLRARG